MARQREPNAIRRLGVRPPQIPVWANTLLGVMAKSRKRQKWEILSESLLAYSTPEERRKAENMGDKTCP